MEAAKILRKLKWESHKNLTTSYKRGGDRKTRKKVLRNTWTLPYSLRLFNKRNAVTSLHLAFFIFNLLLQDTILLPWFSIIAYLTPKPSPSYKYGVGSVFHFSLKLNTSFGKAFEIKPVRSSRIIDKYSV